MVKTARAPSQKRDKSVPVHVLELPLIVTSADRRKLRLRFRAAGIIRNTVTGEALRRLALMRNDPGWLTARAMAPGKDRTAAFLELRERHAFSKYALTSYARKERDKFWVKDHLRGHDMVSTAEAAYAAVERHMFGMGGRPRFKRLVTLRSIASKDDRNIMRLVGDPKRGPEDLRFEYRKDVSLRIRRRRFSPSESHALSMPIRHFRIVRHLDRHLDRYAVQVVVQGPAYQDRERLDGEVGLDIGPSTVAIVSKPWGLASRTQASFETFCPEVQEPWAETRRLRRSVDRSLRANNPDCFDERGRWIRGRRVKTRSKRLLRRQQKLRRQEAKLARRRRNAHGHLSNRILGAGTTIHLESLSYASFQKCFGRSVKVRAPGSFVALLRRKAEAVGGSLIEIPTRVSKLSQLDHRSGDFVRKPLSERRHHVRDGSGTIVQRDVYSAFLALHTDASGVTDRSGAERHWIAGACERLVAVPGTPEAEQSRTGDFGLPSRRDDSRLRRLSPRRLQRLAHGGCRDDKFLSGTLQSEAGAGSGSPVDFHASRRLL